MSETALDKFLRYAKIDTQSKEDVETIPSTAKQFDLAKLLVEELKAMGINNANLDENCYIMATIPSNLPIAHPSFGKVPKVGFIAHVDTSPEVSDTNVNPQIIENYEGGDIVLGNSGVVISVAENKNLLRCIGHTIVTTDGTTLLGSDDKSGLAAIMTLAQTLQTYPDILHGDIKIGFTPDEEVGRGADKFSIEAFGADFAYTVDGDLPGELNKETFSANTAIITVHGRDIHPGMAKDIMVNSIRVISDIISLMPKNKAPETTEKYEQYLHPYVLEGGISKSSIKILLRDFKTSGLEEERKILQKIIDIVQLSYPKAKNKKFEIKESYRNMREKLRRRDPKCLKYYGMLPFKPELNHIGNLFVAAPMVHA